MKRIVVFDNGTNETSIETVRQFAAQAGVAVIGVSSEAHPSKQYETAFSLAESSLQSVIAKASDGLDENDSVLLVDLSQPIDSESLRSSLEAIQASQQTNIVASLSIEGNTVELPELDQACLVREISFQPEWPLVLCVAQVAQLKAINEPQEFDELIAQIIVAALGEHIPFENTENSIALTDGTARKMSPAATARLLRFAINSNNIEELFPNHPWDQHQEESAAACYHTLAANFIRLNDLESATECLAFGDRLEDSPRSLALKGIIALNKGETLSAVANMVSSLQEYERRKKDSDKHYLTFTPRNLEEINESLQSGLSALNQRDNDTAVECFADAVFNFDPFYIECGLREN